MRIEHTGLSVRFPAEMGDWYVKHLGFVMKRSSDSPVPVRFLADPTGRVMIEIYNNPKATPPDYSKMDALLLHLAFVSTDIDADLARLLKAGATIDADPVKMANGDHLAMLRDPWGLAIQLCKRGVPMVTD